MSAPISIGESFDGTVVKFDRKEFNDLLKSDQEWSRPQATLRKRRRHQSRGAVAPSQSKPSGTSSLLSEEEVDTNARYYIGYHPLTHTDVLNMNLSTSIYNRH